MILDGENGVVVADVNCNTATVSTLNINGNATATGNMAAFQISGTANAQDQTVVSAPGYYDNADGHYLGISES